MLYFSWPHSDERLSKQYIRPAQSDYFDTKNVLFTDSEYRICVKFHNISSKPALIYAPYNISNRIQLPVGYWPIDNKTGETDYSTDHSFIPSPPPFPPPPPYQRGQFWIIEAGKTVQACKDFPLKKKNHYKAKTRASYFPALLEEYELPFSKAELEKMAGTIYRRIQVYGRGQCTVDFRDKTADCTETKIVIPLHEFVEPKYTNAGMRKSMEEWAERQKAEEELLEKMSE